MCAAVSPVVKILTYSFPGRLVGVYIRAKAARKAWVLLLQSDLYLSTLFYSCAKMMELGVPLVVPIIMKSVIAEFVTSKPMA